MGVGDHRVNSGITVEPDVRLALEFVLGDAPVVCPVVNLNEFQLKAEYPATAPELPPGQWLANLAIHRPGSAPVHLRVLTLVETSVDARGRRMIQLAAHDEQARAGLWTVVDRIRSGQLGPDPVDGDVPVHIRPVPQRGVYTETARLDRLAYIRTHTGHSLSSLEHTFLRAERLAGNIENLIGSIEVPVGLAGPLLFAASRRKASSSRRWRPRRERSSHRRRVARSPSRAPAE